MSEMKPVSPHRPFNIALSSKLFISGNYFHSNVAYGPLSSAIDEVARSACSTEICEVSREYEANALLARGHRAKPQEPYGPGVSDNKVAFPTRTP
jgi:hypothetical protein